MARIYPLFSSSKGNASFVGSPHGGVLIDAGVSCKRLMQALGDCGIPERAIRGIFITHDHSDHIKGLRMVTKRLKVPVYAQAQTLEKLIAGENLAPGCPAQVMEGTVTAGDAELTAFDIPHDTVQSCGYRIRTGDGRTCAVCTDLGHVTPTVHQALLGCDLVLLEANYDPRMLANGPYPGYLKQRIASERGHLSNPDSGALAAALVAAGTTRLILGHLSQENNTPALAEQTVEQALGQFRRNGDYLLEVAPVETTGRMVVF